MDSGKWLLYVSLNLLFHWKPTANTACLRLHTDLILILTSLWIVMTSGSGIAGPVAGVCYAAYALLYLYSHTLYPDLFDFMPPSIYLRVNGVFFPLQATLGLFVATKLLTSRGANFISLNDSM